MSESETSDLDVVLWAEQDILLTPVRYREAIVWWNENYSRRVYRKKVADELGQRRHNGEKMRRTRHGEAWHHEHRADWFFLTRARDAMDSFPSDPSTWRRLGLRDAARILLLTVLMTRPDFDGGKVGLDEQAKWSDGGLLNEDECFGRDWADGSFTHWKDADGNNGLWLKLARAAWKVMRTAKRLESDKHPLAPSSQDPAAERAAVEPATGQALRADGRLATSAAQQTPLRSWTQTDLDSAIREYKARRASKYGDLAAAVNAGKPGAQRIARKLFGRNVIARELGCKSKAMVSKSPAWKAIASELGLAGVTTAAGRRVGEDIAIEQAAETQGDTVVDQVVRRETIRFINAELPNKEAEALINQLAIGDMSDEDARRVVELYRQQHKDAKARKAQGR